MGRKLGINFDAGNPNAAAGNCLYESIQDNINSRSCFTENLDMKPEYYRYIWNMEGEEKIKMSELYPGLFTEEEWKQGWKILQTTTTYDTDIGNYAINAAAHSIKKDILIINIPWQKRDSFADSPIYVVSSDTFDPSNCKAFLPSMFTTVAPFFNLKAKKCFRLIRLI